MRSDTMGKCLVLLFLVSCTTTVPPSYAPPATQLESAPAAQTPGPQEAVERGATATTEFDSAPPTQLADEMTLARIVAAAFYEAYPELVPYKPTVAAVFMEVQKHSSGATCAEMLDLTAHLVKSAYAISEAFYEAYPELVPYKPAVGATFMEVQKRYPGATYAEMLDLTAHLVKSALGMVEAAPVSPALPRRHRPESDTTMGGLFLLLGALGAMAASPEPSYSSIPMSPSLRPEDIQSLMGAPRTYSSIPMSPSLRPEDIQSLMGASHRYTSPSGRLNVPETPRSSSQPQQSYNSEVIPIFDDSGNVTGNAVMYPGGSATILSPNGDVCGTGTIDANRQRLFLFDEDGDFIGTVTIR